MPDLISASERAVLTGIFGDVFDTFQKPIVIYKEPIKNISQNSNSFLFGFGESQTSEAVSYTEVTGVYPARIRYKKETTDKFNSEVVAWLPGSEASIKVKKDCRDFINDGKTEKITFDDRTFYLLPDERKRVFLDSEFYVFYLSPTK